MEKMPDTLEEILSDIRRRMTPKNDRFAGKDTGVFLYNCGWVAFHGEMSTLSLTDDTFHTAYDAARFLWLFCVKKIQMLEVRE